jgi:hypothetical protein
MEALSPRRNVCNEFIQDLIEVTRGLPEAERDEALQNGIASVLVLMNRPTIHLVRSQLAATNLGGAELESLMNLIEGHLALRTIEQQPAPSAEHDVARR